MELSVCDKDWWVSRTIIEEQTIEISAQLTDLFPNLVATKGGSEKVDGAPLAWKHAIIPHGINW